MQIQDSEIQSQAILQTLADGIVIINDKGIIESLNPAAEYMFGYSATDAIGRYVRDLIPDHDGLFAIDHASKPAEAQWPRIVSLRRELQGRRQDGSIFPIDLAVTEVELGGRRHFTNIVRDITERLEAQEMVQRLAAIVESVDDAIISCDIHGIIDSWNSGAEALYGYTAGEAIGESIEIITPRESVATLAERFRTVLAGSKLEHLETQRLTKHHRKVDVSISGCRILDARGSVAGLAAIHRDISSQKRAEIVQKDLAVVEERNRLSREIHDTLAQSLTAMGLLLELAGRTIVSDPEATRADLKSARILAIKCVEEVRRSIWDLHPQALESSGLADAIKIEVERLRENDIEGEFFVSGSEAIAMARRNQSAALRVVQEALSNVVKHSKAKTAVVSLYFDQEGLGITVTDDGIGFDHRARQTISPTGGGFGITSMQERARLTGGSVQVQSTPGQGTTVVVCIPYRAGEPGITASH